MSPDKNQTESNEDDAAKNMTAQGYAGHRDRFMEVQVKQKETYLTRFDGLSYTLFGDFYDEKRSRFDKLEAYLKQARMPYDVDLYLSRMTLATLLGTGIGLLILTPILGVFSASGMLSGMLPLPSPIDTIGMAALSFIISGIIFVAIGTGITYINLALKASSRRRRIDQTVPYAATFMYALSRGGMNFVQVMRVLADSEDAYGEVSKEMDSILRDMDYMSVDLPRALRRGAQRSPSNKFGDFMDDLVSIIDSGADLTEFLEEKSEEFLAEAEREQKNFLTTLSLLGEVYVTAFVAGPLFLIIITVVMSMLGGSAIVQLYGIVYGLLQLMNFVFFILIDTITTDEGSLSDTIDTNRISTTSEELHAKYDEYASSKNRIEDIIEEKEYRERSEILHNPIGWLLEKPLRSMVFTAPITGIYLVVAFLFQFAPLSFEAMSTDPVSVTLIYILIPLYINFLPLSVIFEISFRRETKLLNRLPDALKQLASSNAIGMTLTESLNTVAESTSGKLGKELEKVGNDIKWNNDINEALISFANRVKLPVVARTVKLITEANQSTGDIADVLDVAAKDIGQRQILKKERSNEMMMYTVVVLISYGVYLFVIAMLDNAFLTEIANIADGSSPTSGSPDSPAGLSGGGTGGGSGAINLSNLPIEQFRMVFYHSTIIQALGSGLLAGQLSKNEVTAGLKYSLILMIISTAVFTFL